MEALFRARACARSGVLAQSALAGSRTCGFLLSPPKQRPKPLGHGTRRFRWRMGAGVRQELPRKVRHGVLRGLVILISGRERAT